MIRQKWCIVQQNRFEGRDRAEYPRIAKDIINEKFNGSVIGTDNKMFVNGRGRDEYVNPSKPIKEDYIYDAKMKASAELDNMLDAGERLPDKPDGEDGHIHKDTESWEYYKTMFKLGNYYFEGVINIQNISKGKLFKDVTKIKDVTEAIMNSYGPSPKFQFLRTSSNNSISQNTENTTKNVKFSISDDDYQSVVDSGDMELAQNMVDEAAKANGYTVKAYHGTGRADRVGNVFRPDRATSVE